MRHGVACSTPYGIRGLGTSVGAIGGSQGDIVLNALRHQRFGHDLPKLGHVIAGRAQRLTASEVWAPTPRPSARSIVLASAQRLTASEVWAPQTAGETGPATHVLNALRHQRFGHAKVLAPIKHPSHVLNALRHQRFGHATCGLGLDELSRNVLNALRHQRFGHN